MIIKKDIITNKKSIVLKNGTKINLFSHVVVGAKIGKKCMIGQGCYIAKDVKIGNNCSIQNVNNLWGGIELGNDVFIGPAVCLTNCRHPESRLTRKVKFQPDKIVIGNRVTIGTNSTIIAPCIIGDDVFIAANSLVLRDIKKGEKVKGIVK